jgi:hypothetical protein
VKALHFGPAEGRADTEGSSIMTELTEVDLKAAPGLYKVTSGSSTVYYVESIEGEGVRAMRCKGTGATRTGTHDDQWIYLTALKSGPRLQRDGITMERDEVDTTDIRRDVLRVGSRHRYEYYVPGGMFDATDFYMTQRACLEIEKLDKMPPEGERTIAERDPRPAFQQEDRTNGNR